MCIVFFVRRRWLSSLFFFFFFQAEDGRRDLVRSRRMGDGYKRRVYVRTYVRTYVITRLKERRSKQSNVFLQDGFEAVFYTHLTLPTKRLM